MSSPNSAASAASSQKLTNSSKSNPCPVCGRTKDGDCRISTDGKMVLCHQNFNHIKTQQPDVWHFDGTSSDNRCGVYVYKEPTTKSIRPKQTRYWEYPARDGSRLVRVGRQDDGAGKKRIWQERWDSKAQKWVSGLGEKDDPNRVDRADIPIYRYAEIQEAIAKGELPYIVEGEPCADIFWKLGLPATTNIGGGGKFTQSDTQDLQGAEVVVIVPDRDKKGIEHAEKVAGYFPDTLWLYPYPESKVWGNLPPDHGLDVADWVEQYKLSADDIKGAIGEKRFLQSVKVESDLTLQESTTATLEPIEEAIDLEIKAGVTGSRLLVGLNKIAAFSGFGIREIRQIYTERVKEKAQVEDREDTASEIAQLLASKSARLDIAEILPGTLAQPIKKLAGKMSLRSECYLLALLTQCASLLPASTQTMLHPPTNYRVRPNYFGAMIAESGEGKSPVGRAIITDPMAALLDKAKADYENALAAYDVDFAAWNDNKNKEDRGPAPVAPVRKVYYFTKQTGEGIAAQAGRMPEQGMLYYCDELASLFKSANQYRGGKGSDEEDLLEYWSGGGATVLRAGGLTVDVRNVSLSIFGNIQPKVLAKFMGDGEDNNGKFARFDFIHQPPTITRLSGDSTTLDLSPMLTSLYQNLDNLSINYFELDKAAHDLFTSFYDSCSEKKFANPKQGMRAMLGKSPEKVGKIATILHCIHAAHSGTEVSQYISADSVRGAIKFVRYTIDQALSISTEGEAEAEANSLAPSLMKILELAERKGGSISARDASKSFTSKNRPTTQQVSQWFGELAELKYGEVTTKGTSFLFTFCPQSPPPPADENQEPVIVSVVPSSDSSSPPPPPAEDITGGAENAAPDAIPEAVPGIKTSPDKGLEPVGGDGDDFLNNLVSRVRSAQTWAEVEAVWNGNEELKVQIKAVLTREELARIGRLYIAARSSNSEE